MTPDKIILPPAVLVGLYKQPLVVTGEAMPIREMTGLEQESPAAVAQPATTPAASGLAPVQQAAPEQKTATAPAATVSVNAAAAGEARVPEARSETEQPPAAIAGPAATANDTKEPGPVQPPIAATAPVAKPPSEPGTIYKFLGKNLQHVLVVVRAPGEPFLPEDELQLLTKMLGACKLNLGDVAIVNDAAARLRMNDLKAQLQPVKALLFGVEPSETGLPLSFPLFKEQEYAGCTYLYCPSLTELNQPTDSGRQLKQQLWGCLKKLFGIA